MHVCFISNDSYSVYCYTAIFSMIKNAHPDDKLFVYILSDGISKENEEILLGLKTDKCNIEIIVPTFDNTDNQIIVHRYKWLIPNILSHLDKVLYLDCDIIVSNSIKELYATNISEYPVAMAKDINNILFANRMNIKQGFYCNSGVILMNIMLWNSQNISNKLFKYTIENQDKIVFKDQDTINAVLDKNIKLIDDIKYNLQCVAGYIGEYDILEFENAKNDASIIHYITEKPLSNSCSYNTPLLSEFWKYFTQTPYFLKDIYKYTKIIVNQELSLIKDNSKLENKFNKAMEEKYDKKMIVIKNNNAHLEHKLNKIIDTLAWWIPVRKWRDAFRAKFM